MDKSFCEQIDRESLVDEYVAGNLTPEMKKKFENHLKECAEHSEAVQFERALKKGVQEFAHKELRHKIQQHTGKKDETRILLMRFAAIFLFVVLTPVILYYNFIPSDTDDKTVSLREQNVEAETIANAMPERSTKKSVPTSEAEERVASEKRSAPATGMRSTTRPIHQPPPKPGPIAEQFTIDQQNFQLIVSRNEAGKIILKEQMKTIRNFLRAANNCLHALPTDFQFEINIAGEKVIALRPSNVSTEMKRLVCLESMISGTERQNRTNTWFIVQLLLNN